MRGRAAHRLWVVLGCVALLDGCGRIGLSDYARELATIDAALAALDSDVDQFVSRGERAAARAELLYKRAALTGQPEQLSSAAAALEQAIELAGPVEELLLLRAELNLKRHRAQTAARTLDQIGNPTASARARMLSADIHVQMGQYALARRELQALAVERPSWDCLARLANLEWLTGDDAKANTLLSQAAALITAKDMRAFAWIELQRGMLQFRRGRFDEALRYYQRADRAYSGHWLIESHRAEVLAARGDIPRALALFQRLRAREIRPEIEQAIGDLYSLLDERDKAKPFYDRALALYLKSARRGDVLYLHHLVEFYTDIRPAGREAVKWARKDLEQRGGSQTHDAMAWAFFRSHDVTHALEQSRLALASGTADAHLLAHAAAIHSAAGEVAEGRRLLEAAHRLNPRYTSFHMHR
jgi:tetratricopeptide (TPR) repeat protein